MSTDEALPIEPPTREEYDLLLERSERNRLRGVRAQFFGGLAVALVLVLAVSGGAIYLSQRNVPDVQRKQGETLLAVRDIVRGLEEQNRLSEDDKKQNALALAVIVENVAAGFGTPPYPDPGRAKAVEGLCETARQFRVAGGDTGPPPVCPAI